MDTSASTSKSKSVFRYLTAACFLVVSGLVGAYLVFFAIHEGIALLNSPDIEMSYGEYGKDFTVTPTDDGYIFKIKTATGTTNLNMRFHQDGLGLVPVATSKSGALQSDGSLRPNSYKPHYVNPADHKVYPLLISNSARLTKIDFGEIKVIDSQEKRVLRLQLASVDYFPPWEIIEEEHFFVYILLN